MHRAVESEFKSNPIFPIFSCRFHSSSPTPNEENYLKFPFWLFDSLPYWHPIDMIFLVGCHFRNCYHHFANNGAINWNSESETKIQECAFQKWGEDEFFVLPVFIKLSSRFCRLLGWVLLEHHAMRPYNHIHGQLSCHQEYFATQPSLKSVCNNWHVLTALLIS